MIRSRLGLKVLGLCAVVLGMMAFASVAQAETNAFWLVNGAKLTSTPSVEAETEVEGVLLTELGGKQIHIKCPGAILVTGNLKEVNKVLGKIIFHGCEFFELVVAGGATKKVGACTPSAGGSSGLIETNLIKGLIKLHEGKAQVEAVPDEAGKPFATINLGEECAFGEKITVEGTFWLNDTASQTNAVKHLVSELKALSKLTVNGGAKVATIDGSAWAFLGGANKGQTFSAQPG